MKGSEMTVGEKYRLVKLYGEDPGETCKWSGCRVGDVATLKGFTDAGSLKMQKEGEDGVSGYGGCCCEWEEYTPDVAAVYIEGGRGISAPEQEPVEVVFEVGDVVEVVGEYLLSGAFRSFEYTSRCGARGVITNLMSAGNKETALAYVDFQDGKSATSFFLSELIFIRRDKDKSEPREESSAEKGFAKRINFDPPLKIPAGHTLEIGLGVDLAGGPDKTVYYKITKPMSAYQKISRSLRKMLDPDTKVLVQAGYLNEELSLTGLGQQVLLEILKGVYKKELVAEAKADLKFKKETSEEND